MHPGKILTGTVLHGEYVLLGPIGEVGHDVFRANHHGDNRTVAIRIWRGDSAGDVGHNLELAEMASRIRHPLLANVEAYGQQSDGTLPFIVSEYVAGQRLDQWADSVGIPPLAAVMDFVHRLCLALHVVHRAGFAHCAVNPRNLVMSRGSTAPGQRLNAKLLDLGVPNFMRSKPPRLRSAQFMAPEQLAAALQASAPPSLETDSRVDVYACGCLLYYLCTGGAPFQSRSLRELIAAHAGAKMLPPSRINPRIPEALEAIILRALSPEVQERYRDGAELAGALDEVRRSSSVSGVIPRLGASSPPSQELESEAAAMFSDDGFDERPTSLSEISVAALRAESLLEPTPPEAPEAQSEVLTERPPPPSAPTSAGSSFAPPPTKVPELRHPFDPLAALSIPPSPRRTPSSPVPARAAATLLGAHASVPTSSSTGSMEDVASAKRWHWHHEWWLWAVAGALCVVAYLQLERWYTPARSAVRVVQLQPRPSSSSQSVPTPQSAAPLPTREPKAAGRVASETKLERPRATIPTSSAKTSARSASTSLPSRNVRNERYAATAALAQRAAPAAPERAVEGSPGAVSKADTAREAQARERPIFEQPEEPPLPESSNSARRSERPTVAAASSAPSSRNRPVEANRSPEPLAADARILELSVRGSLATSEVRRAIERIQPLFVQCYARSAIEAGRNAFGGLSLEVGIDESGRARDPHVTGGALPGLDRCVERAAAKIASMRPPDTGTVKASCKVAFVARTP